MYRIRLSTGEILGEEELPPNLAGLALETLADLSAGLDPCPPEFVDIGFWPGVSDATVTGAPVSDRVARAVREAVPVVQPPAVLVVSPLTFARRLTLAERMAIRASTNAVVQDFLWMLDRAQVIQLDDPDTVTGVRYLEEQHLIGVGRAAEILSQVAQ